MRYADEEPDFGSDEHLEQIFEAEEGCEFCGHTGHRMSKCDVRYQAYTNPQKTGGYRRPK